MSLLLTLLFLVLVSFAQGRYDAAKEINRRVDHLMKTCENYRRKETSTDHPRNDDPSANYVQNWASKFFVCVPAENGAVLWNRFFRQMHNYDLKKYGTFNHTENFVMTKPQLDTFFKESHRSIVARHPLERMLSLYLTTFRYTDEHFNYGITSRIKEFWLNTRNDLEPRADEASLDIKSRSTLTFRQFIHFLMDCQMVNGKIVKSCNRWFMHNHVGMKWLPTSEYCQPCIESMEPTSIIHLEKLTEDKEYVFGQVGLQYDFAWERNDDVGEFELAHQGHVKKKYFSTLSKSEIIELYKMTQLDHELFGYSPDEFVSYGS